MGEVEKTSEAWNVAQGFTQLKILKPLVETDKLLTIALYGTEQIEDAFTISEGAKTEYRIQAIRRLIDVLRMIIENSYFACKVESKETLDQLENRISQVLQVLDGITYETTDQRTNSKIVRINEKHFQVCLEELRKVKKEIPIPLNDNSLIFPQSDEVDLDKIKKQLIEGG